METETYRMVTYCQDYFRANTEEGLEMEGKGNGDNGGYVGQQ